MMFDPPDYPYKELSETFDELLLNKNNSTVPDAAHETIINSLSNPLSFHSNDSGRYFNPEHNFVTENNSNVNQTHTHFYTAATENLLSYEPTLLDERTVNQFLIPLQDSGNNDKETDNSGPDLLALHSCVICHDIFTTETDLLDHTIALHASANIAEPDLTAIGKLPEQLSLSESLPLLSIAANDESHKNADFESDWLCCRVCQRVLSTAVEIEPAEQLCCIDISGKCSVYHRRLHTMFVCDVCSGLFADGEALDQHRITCYGEEGVYESGLEKAKNTTPLSEDALVPRCPPSIPCSTCGQQFPSPEDLKQHLLTCQRPRNVRRSRAYTASSSKMWNCGSCNQLFTTARELYRHKRGEDRPEGAPLTAYVCEECDKVLGSMCALHTHKKMHKVSKPGYPCRICGRRFNQSGHLAIHMRMHTGERPYPCDLCTKAFKVKVERDDHRRTHTGERPFACAACPKTFTAAARLREHARIHTDQRPYICDICGAAFRRPYARTVHTLIHTGEKPHECDVCGTAFRRSGDMWKHKRTLHGA